MQVNGLDQAKRLFQKLQAEASTKNQELLKAMGGLAEKQTRERLSKDKEAPDGTPWPELDPKYAKSKKQGTSQRDASSGGLLELTGNLITDINDQLLDSENVAVGSTLEYAATHDQGSEKRGIPQRQFLGLSDENKEEIHQTLQEKLEEWI